MIYTSFSCSLQVYPYSIINFWLNGNIYSYCLFFYWFHVVFFHPYLLRFPDSWNFPPPSTVFHCIEFLFYIDFSVYRFKMFHCLKKFLCIKNLWFCCCRSVFGGTVGPNQQKQQIVIGAGGSGTEQHGTTSVMFYEGIKVRATPYSIPVSTTSLIQQQPPSPQAQQRKSLNVVTPPPPTTSPAPAPEGTPADASLPLTPAPASPILKAQLSAPPKPRETPKGDGKSQVRCIHAFY